MQKLGGSVGGGMKADDSSAQSVAEGRSASESQSNQSIERRFEDYMKNIDYGSLSQEERANVESIRSDFNKSKSYAQESQHLKTVASNETMLADRIKKNNLYTALWISLICLYITAMKTERGIITMFKVSRW